RRLQIVGDVVGDFLEAFDQHLDAFEHRVEIYGETVKFVIGIVDRQTAGEIAAHNAAGRFGHGIDAFEHATRDKEAARKAEHDHQRDRPAAGLDDDIIKSFALFEVATYQQAETALELCDVHERAMLAAFGIFEPLIDRLGPTRLIQNALAERADVSNQRAT